MIIKYDTGTLEFTPTCDILILKSQLNYMANYIRSLKIRAKIEKIELPKI